MIVKKLKILLLVFFFCLVKTNTWAWWSATILDSSTHHKITDQALALIPSSIYGDVKERFGNDISNWTSGPNDDTNAHNGDNAANGGPIDRWWEFALDQYETLGVHRGRT